MVGDFLFYYRLAGLAETVDDINRSNCDDGNQDRTTTTTSQLPWKLHDKNTKKGGYSAKITSTTDKAKVDHPRTANKLPRSVQQTKKKRQPRKNKKKPRIKIGTKGRAVMYVDDAYCNTGASTLHCTEPSCTRKYKTRIRLERHRLIHNFLKSLGGCFADGELNSLRDWVTVRSPKTGGSDARSCDARCYKCPDGVCTKSFKTVGESIK